MIRRREAIRITLCCDACQSTTETYSAHAHDGVNWPAEWTSFPEPEYLIEDAAPRVVLCPKHAHLQDVARLVASMLDSARQEQPIA